jgi:hypothetical protein
VHSPAEREAWTRPRYTLPMKRWARGLLKVALAVALFVVAMKLRVRNERMGEGGGVLTQVVSSLWFLMQLALRPRSQPARGGVSISAAATVGVTLLLSWVSTGLVIPLLVAVTLLFVVSLRSEKVGRRAFRWLVLLVPLAIWGVRSVRMYRRVQRIEHVEAADLARVTLTSPEGRAFVIEDPFNLRNVAILLTRMRPFDRNHEGMVDAWTGLLELRDGTREPWQLGRSSREPGVFWVAIEDLDYWAPFDFPATIDELTRGAPAPACAAAVVRICASAARCSPPAAHIHVGAPGEPGTTTILHESEASCAAYYDFYLCRSATPPAPPTSEEEVEACAAAIARAPCEDAPPASPPASPDDRAVRATGACAALLRIR